MRWSKEDIGFLKENYPKNISLENISKQINKTIESIQHKAVRMKIHRPRFLSHKPRKRQPRKLIDRRYYEKNKEKVYRRKMNRRKRLKEEAVKISGGKCKICGYNKCISALEFHHSQKNKENNVSSLLKNESRQKLLKEAGKCILLCANCHREAHHGSVV